MLYFPLKSLRRRWGWSITLVIISLVTIGWRWSTANLAGGVSWSALGPARWLDWTLGALAAELALSHAKTNRRVLSLPLFFVCFTLAVELDLSTSHDLLLTRQLLGDVSYALAFFFLVLWAVDNEALATKYAPVRLLSAVGVFSYSLYLTHEPTIVFAKKLGMNLHGGIIAITALRIVVPIVVAYIFHVMIEQRFMRKPVRR